MKFDMHCHTKEGSPDGKLALLDNIKILKDKGYAGMLITDHNSYRGYRYYQKLSHKPEHFVVLRGIEYDTIDAGHILVIMPRGVRLPILELRGLPVLLLIEIVHHYGGILGPAHPCGEKFLSIFHTLRGIKGERIYSRFDFVEGYNACEDADSNHRAMMLAARHNLPCLGGSDSHRAACAGLGYTIFQSSIQTEDDLIDYIRSMRPTRVGGRHYAHTTKSKLGHANDLLVYSFWVYNKFLAIARRKARNLELVENHILETLRKPSHTDSGNRHYITLSDD